MNIEIRMSEAKHRILITGAAGFIGSRLVQMLGERYPDMHVVATARRPLSYPLADNVHFAELDVREPKAAELMREHAITQVVHLASVVTPGPNMDRATMRSIDVDGTQNMLDASLAAGVSKFIVTTSAASYGYHADNPVPLDEQDALRGNVAFAYSDHKRLIEALLADYKTRHPELAQVIFRPGFVLGHGCENQITNLFTKPVMVGIRGAASPFTIIWDEDVCQCIIEAITSDKTGIYNLVGDGTLSLKEMAQILGKRYLALPATVMQSALFLAQRLGLTQYGPEQLDFIRYRPVLSNQRLKTEFGYTPKKTSRECFIEYASHAGLMPSDNS